MFAILIKDGCQKDFVCERRQTMDLRDCMHVSLNQCHLTGMRIRMDDYFDACKEALITHRQPFSRTVHILSMLNA